MGSHLPADLVPTDKRELYQAAETLIAHSVGYCEDLYVVETADIKLDFEERGDRIRAAVEVHSTVSIERSKESGEALRV